MIKYIGIEDTDLHTLDELIGMRLAESGDKVNVHTIAQLRRVWITHWVNSLYEDWVKEDEEAAKSYTKK